MDITGKIIQVLPLQQGTSQRTGNPWVLQSYVLETQEQYPKKVCFEVFGEDKIKANTCNIDDVVTVSFDLESREYNGRWYTSIRAWKVQPANTDNAAPAAAPTNAAAAQTAPAPAIAPTQSNTATFDQVNDDTSDLPF